MSDTTNDPFEEFAATLAATEEAYKKTASQEPVLPAPTASEAEHIDAYVEFLEWEKQRKAAEAAYVKARKAAFASPVHGLGESVIHKYGDAFESMFPNGYIFAGNKHAVSISPKTGHKFDQERLRQLDVSYFSGRPTGEAIPGIAPKYAVDMSAIPPHMVADVSAAIMSTTTKPVITPVKNFYGAAAGWVVGASATVLEVDEC